MATISTSASMPGRLQECISRAIGFLACDQLRGGEFCTVISPDALLERQEFVLPSVFVTALVAHCLSFVPDHAADRTRLKACDHLIAAMTPPGLWTDLDVRRHSDTAFDHDLDSTCCASFATKEIHEGIRAGSNVDAILKNRNAAGLFLTWVRMGEAPNNVDSVVNANVLLFLGDRPETKQASLYLNTLIADNRDTQSSSYYLDDMALYYMLSRAAWQSAPSLLGSKSAIIEKVLAWSLSDGSFGDDLHAGLALCTLMNLGHGESAKLDEAAVYLLKRQRSDGAWPRTAFYAVPEPPAPRGHWFGSEALTTALCVEALARYASQNGAI